MKFPIVLRSTFEKELRIRDQLLMACNEVASDLQSLNKGLTEQLEAEKDAVNEFAYRLINVAAMLTNNSTVEQINDYTEV